MPSRPCIVCGALSSRNSCPAHRGHRNGSTREWRKTRAAVLTRDGGRCRYPTTNAEHGWARLQRKSNITDAEVREQKNLLAELNGTADRQAA